MIELLKNRLENKIIEISNNNFRDLNPSPLETFLIINLSIISFIYKAVTKIRVLLYRKKLLKNKKLPCFVISIGNITSGGSGKTPMAIYLAETMKQKGFKPVVLSRGYKGSMEKDIGIAGDGRTVISSPEEAGDEPYMMAKRCSFPVLVGQNRFKTGKTAINLFAPDIIILDDGFQHIQLQRDLDIVLLDYKRPFGNGKLLPLGRLRETPDEIKKRTDIIIFTRCPLKSCRKNYNIQGKYRNNENIISKQHKLINSMGKPLFFTRHIPFLYTFQKYGKETSYGYANYNSKECKTSKNIPDNYDKLKGNYDGEKSNSTYFYNNYDHEQNHETKRHKFKLNELNGRKAFLFSGIADNGSFRKTIEHLNILVSDHLEFADHYRYNKKDIKTIIESARKSGADLIITTEKDYARLCDNIDWKMDMAVIGIKIDWTVNGVENEDEFIDFISRRISIYHRKKLNKGI